MWEAIVTRQTGFLNLSREHAEAFRQTAVAVFGTGGNGAILDHLVRLGFERFEIVDFDLVEDSNLNRLPFTRGQIGLPKVEAWAGYLKDINHDCRVTTHQNTLTHRDADLVAEIISNNDLVALGTTSLEANLVISRLCHRAKRRMIVGPAASGSLVVSTFTHQNDVTLEKIADFQVEHLELDQIDYKALLPKYAGLLYYPGRNEKYYPGVKEKVMAGELDARSCKVFVSLTNAAMAWEMVKNAAVINGLPLENTQVVEMPVMQLFDVYRGGCYYWNYQTRQIGIPNWLDRSIAWQDFHE